MKKFLAISAALVIFVLAGTALIINRFIGLKSGPNKLASVQVESGNQSETDLNVVIESPGKTFNLNLTRLEDSIFGSEFHFTLVNSRLSDENETFYEYEDQTPSKEVLRSIEDGMLVDPSNLAAIKVEETNGQFKMKGIIENYQIHQDEDHGVHYIRALEPETKVKVTPKAFTSKIVDYIELHRPNNSEEPDPEILTRTTTVATVEILVVVDYMNYQTFFGNITAISEYFSIFYRSVSNRYASISDPKIALKVSGIVAFGSRASQPFLESSKIPDGSGYDIKQVLEGFSSWDYISLNKNPKHDVAAFISAETFKSKDSNGKWIPGISGLAYIGSACWKTHNKFLGVSVNSDRNGVWSGTLTAAHEMAHNLNVPHDGDLGASQCPWSGGYIMSYQGYGEKNKFYFSPCSQSIMKDFVSSKNGACLRSIESPQNTFPISEVNPGNRLDMNEQCQKHTGNRNAMVETQNRTPAEMCRNLKCRITTGTNGWVIHTLNRIPADDSPCDVNSKNMVCRNGECVASTKQ